MMPPAETAPTTVRLCLAPRWTPAACLCCLGGMLMLAARLPSARSDLFAQSGAAFLTLGLWACALGLRKPVAADRIPVDLVWHSGIWLQAAAQSILFAYWSFYCPEVAGRATTILIQLLFVAAVDMLSNWRSRARLQASSSVLPIMLSVNLFLWHDDRHAWESLVILAVAVLSKSLWRWKDARYGHIFNPSAIALSLAGIIYYCLGRWTYVRLDELFLIPPNFSEIILIAGLLIQFGRGTGVTTLGGIVSMMALDVTLLSIGIHNVPFPFEGQNYVGLTLLITDPATSPRSLAGRAMFGALYGALFVVIFRSFHAVDPSYVYFSKIFAAPLANLLVPWFDRQTLAPTARPWSAPAPGTSAWQLGSAAAVVLSFVAVYNSEMKTDGFETPMRAAFKIQHAPRIQRASRDGRRVFCEDNPVYCRPFSFKEEFELWAMR